MKLIGINKRPKIIATQAPKDEDTTIRIIFHLLSISEENIFGKRTPFDTPGYSRVKKDLTSLLYLINGDGMTGFLPDVSVEELEKRAAQKAVLINYLNQKISGLSKQRKQLEKAKASDEDVDARNDELVA